MLGEAIELVVDAGRRAGLRPRRSRPGRAGPRQPRAERPRRDAGRRHADDRDAGVDADGRRTAAEHEVRPGRYVVRLRRRHRRGHGRGRRLERVFEPFFTTKPPARGRASVSRASTARPRRAAASSALESEPGRGSTFEIHFPLADGAVAPCSRRGRPGRARGFRRNGAARRGRGDRARARRHARSNGRATGCSRRTTGLRRSTSAPRRPSRSTCSSPTWSMPGMGGRELAERVLELDAGTPVVFMSGYTDESVGQRARRAEPRRPSCRSRSRLQTLVGAVGDALEAPAPTAANGSGDRREGRSPASSPTTTRPCSTRSRGTWRQAGIDVVARVAARRRGARRDRGPTGRRSCCSTSRWSRSTASRSPGEPRSSRPRPESSSTRAIATASCSSRRSRRARADSCSRRRRSPSSRGR